MRYAMIYMENIKHEGDIVSFDGYTTSDKISGFHYSFNVFTGETLENTGGGKFHISEAKFRILSVLSANKPLPSKMKANTH